MSPFHRTTDDMLMSLSSRFPLKEHLISVKREISAPKYVEEHPVTDMTSILHNNKQDTYESVNILHGWPKSPQSTLDKTQLSALERILTKKLAIIQGPPGTGKTLVSTEAIRIMLANRSHGDPPIIIACQTNHAVDQLLNLIAVFETEFIRLGGRSKETGIVKQRTLYEVRKHTSENPLAGCLKPNARRRMKHLEEEIKVQLSPLNPSKLPLEFNMLKGLGLLTEGQAESLQAGASRWVQSHFDDPNQSPFTVWLGKSLVSVPLKQMPENYGFDYEEAELEAEQLREVEAENVANDDEEYDRLIGDMIPIADNFTCRKPTGKTQEKDFEEAKAALMQENMWNID
jgi:helicase required for RNAi-mediated heterochromatin assembly 1